MICKLCNSKNVNIIYNGKIRDGHVGNYTTSDVQMFKCCDCNTIWHEDVIDHSNYYETEKYRSSLEGTTDIKDFYKTQAKKRKNTVIAYYCTLFENVSRCGQILANAAGVCRFLISG